jgi:hypothetical protein
LRRISPGIAVLAALGLPAVAAPARPARSKPLAAAAGASSLFDHVPIAAERIAAAFGVVTSTFRTIAHNHAVGGVPNSFHLLGRAIDVARKPGVTHAQIAAALRAAGYALIESLDEGDHSHFAFGPALVRQAALAPVRQEPAKPAGPRVAADEHGSLLADVVAYRKVNGAAARASRSAR